VSNEQHFGKTDVRTMQLRVRRELQTGVRPINLALSLGLFSGSQLTIVERLIEQSIFRS